MNKMKTVIFENNDDGRIGARCKCFIDDPCWDVFEHNCPMLEGGVKYCPDFKEGTFSADTRRVKVRFCYDYYFEIEGAFDGSRACAQKCPFNADVAKKAPAVDTSCMEMKFDDRMVTVFDTDYMGVLKDMPECQCNLAVPAFAVFRQHCPACNPKTLPAGIGLSQYYMFDGDERCVTIDADHIPNSERVDMVRKTALAMKAAAKNCIYNRCRKEK